MGRVEVVAGSHLVASVDGVVVVVAHRDSTEVTATSESVAVLDKLLELVADASSRETRRTGRTFARLVSTWLMAREDEERVEFGVLTPGVRGLAVFLHGRVTAVLEGDDHREVLHGRDAAFTVDRVVSPGPARAAAVFVDEDEPRADLPQPGIWTLRDGRVPGSGAVMWLGEEDESQSRRGSSAVRRARARVDSGRKVRPFERRNGRGEAESGITRKPAANASSASSAVGVNAPTAQPGARAVTGVVVSGFTCARGHLNDPRAAFCTACGISMDQATRVLTEGIRPPLGVLKLDDGTSYVLDSDLVIGREPERSEQVRRGAQAIRIPDASGGMSRVHAEIRLVDWEVVVMDRGSANGTHIRLPGRPDWVRAVPGQLTVLEPGSQLLLGGRVFTFDSPHGR
ncbi:FHA domain-containing protein [Nocardia sp. CDC160]|uniref:FHA domain-containing protein n=1 Tax=Nocardia sp. CDC160 TaxID=3112166 RepID=UPI002DBFEA1D|nr:FHA domain-containing protein [Nocardia sp. CDC160]MEC3917579.1 FHA domain-containing protein [Nocardia sp. CDC160]